MTPPTTRPTVLISDDEPLVVAAFAREGRRRGLSVVSDCFGEQLVELARAVHPDLIILDVHHRVDGRVLLARLKRDSVTRTIRVLMLSGVEDQLTRHLCLGLGAVDYEVKPMDAGFMNKVLRMVGLEPTERRALQPA